MPHSARKGAGIFLIQTKERYMKKIVSVMSVILLFTMLTFLASCSRNSTVTVKANKNVVELVKKWDPKISFYTSKKNPLKSIEGLKQEEIACWGRELAPNIMAFYDAAGVQKVYGDAVQVIGPDNPIFAMERSPRIYLLSSEYASRLKEAVKVQFSE
jgi:hypothetical protein